MQWILRTIPRPLPIVLAIAAVLCAGAVVLFYQYRALTTLHSQTRVIFQQISEQTASDIALEIRRTLDGPVLDTLLAVTHPELRAGRLDLVAQTYEAGLTAYPQVDRFFVWSRETNAVAPGEALFYERAASRPAALTVGGGSQFSRDPDLGRQIIEIAKRNTRSQHIYGAAEVGPNGRHVFLRLYWTDARRLDYYAVLGFVVEPSGLTRMFEVLYERSLESLLRKHGAVPLELRVSDERGRLVYGRRDAKSDASAVTVPMLFYPAARIESRLVSSGIDPEEWRVEVSAPLSEAAFIEGYWPSFASVVLMVIAFGITVRANRRAADLARMQADFIAHASHQLKTPLSLLSAATETVQMAHVHTPEKLAQYLGIIRTEVTQLSSLVQRILEFSRLQQPRSYEFEEINLLPLVRETVEAFERSLAAHQFTFVILECVDEAPVVYADPAAVEQVLANLLDNAVKYSGGAREVHVRVCTAGTDALIEVIDHGPGIAREDCARIFEKFYRGAASSHRNGFGLGLAIVHELVSAQRGKVTVESSPGTGSTFRVVLPLRRRERNGTTRHEPLTRSIEAQS